MEWIKIDKNGMDLLVGSYGMLFVKIRQIWKIFNRCDGMKKSSIRAFATRAKNQNTGGWWNWNPQLNLEQKIPLEQQ